MGSFNLFKGPMALFRLLIVFLALTIAGCGGGGGGGGTTSGGTTATTGSLKVTNTTGQTIMYLYVSPASSASWGVDQLGTSTIANNASFTLTNIPAGSYDVKAVLADGTSKTQMGVSIAAGVTTTITFSTATTGTTGSLKVTNSTGQTLWNLYVTPVTATTWGVDQLGASTIANGSSFTVTNIPPGSYDVKAVLADGTILYQYGVTISANLTTTITFGAAAGGTATVKITNLNAAGLPITQFYLTTSTANWGANQLGSATIAYGATFTLTGVPAGSYYAKAVRSDGATSTDTAPNSIAAGVTFTFTYY